MTQQPKQELSLFDSTCLIVGIIIGAGIYQMAPDIAKGTGDSLGVVGIWILGGILSLCGALCYAELATALPREGGDYVYLSRAYGKWAGFLFGWTQLAIVRPGDIAVMAFAFATYARAIYDPLHGSSFPYMQQIYAVAATLVFTMINILGVRKSTWTQNILTTTKAVGLLFIVGVAFAGSTRQAAPVESAQLPYSLALIFVLFAYGGWNEMAYVAAEVKNPQKNIVRAMFMGIGAVMVLYLLVNIAFLNKLGFSGLASSKAVATETIATLFPQAGSILISSLICVSALGAVNGLVFTGARISYAMGIDHQLFRPLGTWNSNWGTPALALMVQGVIAITLIVVLGSFMDAILYTAAAVYSFYLASTMAVIVLRYKEPLLDRPYKVLGYPITPVVFALVCLFLIRSAILYKPWVAGGACILLLLGIPLYWFSKQLKVDGQNTIPTKDTGQKV